MASHRKFIGWSEHTDQKVLLSVMFLLTHLQGSLPLTVALS